MLLKWIRCEVPQAQRAAFSEAQAGWARVGAVRGFAGQCGGWCTDNESAGLLALWDNAGAYDEFMQTVHDDIVASNKQAGTYDRIEVGLHEVRTPMTGRHSGLAAGLPAAAFLRIAAATVRPERRAAFEATQTVVWTPGMAATPGMLGGVFAVNRDDANRYLVVTAWESEAAHAAYVAGPFAGLRAAASPEADLQSLVGWQVLLNERWAVQPAQLS